MYFELFKEEISRLPGIQRNNLVTYSAIEGPNDAGKSTITNLSSAIIGSTLSTADFYIVAEPPYIVLPQLKTEKTVRDFLKSGDAGIDPREPAGVFCMARRRLQREIHGDEIGSDCFVEMGRGKSLWPRERMVITDRGLPSTEIFQVRAPRGVGGVSKAREIQNEIESAYRANYLLPYDLTVFIQPLARLNNYDPEDFFEGKCNEPVLYAQEIRERSPECFYSNRIVWVENDPTGSSNLLSEPVVAVAAANIAVFTEKNLEIGTRYQIPLIFPEVNVIFRDGKFGEIRSGNVVVSQRGKAEACFEITSNIPQIR